MRITVSISFYAGFNIVFLPSNFAWLTVDQNKSLEDQDKKNMKHDIFNLEQKKKNSNKVKKYFFLILSIGGKFIGYLSYVWC